MRLLRVGQPEIEALAGDRARFAGREALAGRAVISRYGMADVGPPDRPSPSSRVNIG